MSIIEQNENIYKVLGFSDWEAEELQLRSSLMKFLMAYVREKKLSLEAASRLFNIEVINMSHLLNGRMDLFSTKGLLKMLEKIE
ncbi:MAG: XRE family transcriptional regulator [Proteobacteria bacterium]|nr:XRE family transcriptional regulator [Pseudomonadota bacterium]